MYGAFEYFETTPGYFQLIVETDDGWNMVSIPGNHPGGNTISNWWAEEFHLHQCTNISHLLQV